MMQNRRCAFALPELLAVGVMIGILALAFLPLPGQLQRGRQCVENLRQLGRAVQLYALDHEDALPGNQHSLPSWVNGLAAYCPSEAYLCPQSRSPGIKFNVAMNDFLTARPYGARHLDYSRLPDIPAPGETLLFAEADPKYQLLQFDHFHFAERKESGYTAARFREQVEVQRHGDGANYLFPDEHVEAISWSAAAARLRTPHARFVHPEGTAPEGLIVAR